MGNSLGVKGDLQTCFLVFECPCANFPIQLCVTLVVRHDFKSDQAAGVAFTSDIDNRSQRRAVTHLIKVGSSKRLWQSKYQKLSARSILVVLVKNWSPKAVMNVCD